jgi:hypothetical protein
MCTLSEEFRAATVQIERVDNWHARWSEVLDAIDFVGERNALSIDADGWLSARQNLFVAFVGEAIAGHLCFRVEPATRAGTRVVEARLESQALQPGFARVEIEPQLHAAAQRRAGSLRCVGWAA